MPVAVTSTPAEGQLSVHPTGAAEIVAVLSNVNEILVPVAVVITVPLKKVFAPLGPVVRLTIVTLPLAGSPTVFVPVASDSITSSCLFSNVFKGIIPFSASALSASALATNVSSASLYWDSVYKITSALGKNQNESKPATTNTASNPSMMASLFRPFSWEINASFGKLNLGFCFSSGASCFDVSFSPATSLPSINPKFTSLLAGLSASSCFLPKSPLMLTFFPRFSAW